MDEDDHIKEAIIRLILAAVAVRNGHFEDVSNLPDEEFLARLLR